MLRLLDLALPEKMALAAAFAVVEEPLTPSVVIFCTVEDFSFKWICEFLAESTADWRIPIFDFISDSYFSYFCFC